MLSVFEFEYEKKCLFEFYDHYFGKDTASDRALTCKQFCAYYGNGHIGLSK